MSECIFCKIISREVQSNIVYEDDQCVAFTDINPQAPVHLLIVPRRHIPTLLDLGEEDREWVGHLFLVANRLAQEKKIHESGFRTVFNCKNDGGQLVYHLHLHLLGGRRMTWPPG